jgi:centromeric protein E
LGKLTENCDTLGIRETQEFKLLNPSYPELGLAVTYSQGDMCFDVKEEEGL